MNMRISTLLLIVLLTLCDLTHAQNLTGTWEGTLNAAGQKIPLVLHITHGNSGIECKMDSPLQGAMGLAIDSATFTHRRLQLTMQKLMIQYTGQLSEADNELQGEFTQGSMKFPLNFTKTNAPKHLLRRPQEPMPPFDYPTAEVRIRNVQDSITLAGTLTTPKMANEFTPVVIMITGSGSQNRNEEVFGHKPFLVLAHHLALQGFSSLRIDDRGVGLSDKGKGEATSENFATDISAAVDYLKDRGFKKIGLLGHSEGGLIGAIVCSKRNDIAFFIMMAGPGIPGKDLLYLQTLAIGKSSGASFKDADRQAKENKQLNEYIIGYKGDNFSEDIRSRLLLQINTSADSSLTEDRKQGMVEQAAREVDNAWYRYFIASDPVPFIEKIKCPVLAINGTKDLQVLYKENLEGIALALKKNKHKQNKVVPLDGLNHLFQTAPTGAISEYGQIEETIAPKALLLISDWIKSL